MFRTDTYWAAGVIEDCFCFQDNTYCLSLRFLRRPATNRRMRLYLPEYHSSRIGKESSIRWALTILFLLDNDFLLYIFAEQFVFKKILVAVIHKNSSIQSTAENAMVDHIKRTEAVASHTLISQQDINNINEFKVCG